jgi:hypothetical protein
MSFVSGSLVALVSFTAFAEGVSRRDELFESWEKAQRGVRSLVVEFTLETRDPVYNTWDKTTGTLRLLRTRTGKILASYEVIAKKPKEEKPERSSGLLNGGSIYLLNHDNKHAMRFEPAGGDVRGFLETYFNPFVVLLDRKHALETFEVKVVKKDEWYTYLALKPRVKPTTWSNGFNEGRVALLNKASEGVPKDMPVQLWYADSFCQRIFKIKVWRMNADALKEEEFAKPEDRPGWLVVDFPFRSKK